MLKLYISRLLLRFFYLFPINKRKVFFSSFEGGPISCNPKYIYRELKKRYGSKLIYVWEWNRSPEEQEGAESVVFVKHNSISYIFHIMSAGVLISNTGISAVFPLRQEQLSINTWHGAGCYKKVGRDLAETNNKEHIKRYKYAAKNTTYFLSGCRIWTEVFSAAVFADPRKFLPVGSPRVDFLLQEHSDDLIKRIKNKAGIVGKFVLYAPTYRGGRHSPAEAACPMNVPILLDSLKERFGGDWTFAYRCHYATASNFKCIENTVDLSAYDDMQELLATCDVLISDYSSSIWDYSFTGKPCFLYCYDLNDYTDERDFYRPIQEWHFPISVDMPELIKQIKEFDPIKFRKGMERHHSDLDSYETGNAADRVAELIEKHLD